MLCPALKNPDGSPVEPAVVEIEAILACLRYVDLNSIPAGLSKTLEGSDFTSVLDRIDDLKQAKKRCADTSAQCAGPRFLRRRHQ